MTTKANIIQEFFVPIDKVKPKDNEEVIPELIHVAQPKPDPVHPNPKVAEWITDVKKRERK